MSLPKRAYRLDHLPPYRFAIIGQNIADMISEGKDVLRLDIGSPDMPPPNAVVDMLKESASNPDHHQYSSYRGDPSFRKSVADYYQRRFGVELDSKREVLPLLGSKEGIVNFSLAYLDRGDLALIGDIAYPAYSMGAKLADGDVSVYRMDPNRGFLPDFDSIDPDDLKRSKLLWVNYPNNPTGATAELDFYAEAVDFCRKHNLILCSDNPYCEVVFDGYHAPSALQIPGAKDCTVEFMSLSKTYNMAGWRIGAAVGNREALDTLLNVKSNVDSAHWRAIYDASAYALDHTPQSWLDERNERYSMRRDKLLAALPEIGLEAFKSSASLYVWARVLGGDDEAYTEHALREALVAVTPGSMYGTGGQGYIRFSLGVKDERLDEAIARLKEWHKVHA